MKKVPARIHVILARGACSGIIIRRGPSKSTCTIGWDRGTDRFEVGQWLRGRIYERRCDLSPDGRHFIYFAMNGKWAGPVKGSWTAISRAPYLKAIALWPSGDCWNGGGLFMSDTSFWRNVSRWQDDEEVLSRLPGNLTEQKEFPHDESYGGECSGVYYIRLQRDGWKLMRNRQEGGDDHLTVFEMELPEGWVLEKTAHATINHPVGKGCYYDTHRLLHPESGVILDRPDWEWADLDRHRLAWAESGMLFAAEITTPGPGEAKMLFDFNPLEFEAIPAPY